MSRGQFFPFIDLVKSLALECILLLAVLLPILNLAICSIFLLHQSGLVKT